MKVVVQMKVDMSKKNPALESLLTDSAQTIFLDANFFIPPDRSNVGAKPITFSKFCEIWLDPLFDSCTGLAIHEAVYKELVEETVKRYADQKNNEAPTRLRIFKDSELNGMEQDLMRTFIERLARYSKYIPERDNAKDRGEVKSLSYMAVKRYLYFAANDTLPVLLIRNAEELGTGLDDMEVLEMFDVIYFLYRTGKYDNKGLRLLYKYQYHLTGQEKRQNPEWGEFIKQMDLLYPQ